LRIDDERWSQLERLVVAANARSVAAGVPPAVTASSLVGLWIRERVDLEAAKLARRK